MKKEKIKKLLAQLKEFEDKKNGVQTMDEDIGGLTSQIIAEETASITKKLNENAIIKALNKVSKEIEKVKSSFDIKPIVSLVEEIKSGSDLNEASIENIFSELEDVKTLISNFDKSRKTDNSLLSQNLKQVQDNFEQALTNLSSSLETSEEKAAEEEKMMALMTSVSDLDESLKKLRAELNTRINNIPRGGGNANRNIAIGGNTSVLSTYTDINLKAGSNVTITYVKNNATKYTDVTISSSGGGGGSVGGTVRSINNISTSQTAGNNSGTDYVYIASAGIALTLPTAAGNTNQYTLKNTSNSSVVLIPDGAETIDSASNAILTFKYTSVDVISDGTSNWNIT